MNKLTTFPPKRNFQILFRDSSEYFHIDNARMFTEGPLVRFIVFNEEEEIVEDIYYPLCNVYRIKAFKQPTVVKNLKIPFPKTGRS